VAKEFLDTAVIQVLSGKGGDGRASFRREKFVPRGGPDGGDGGKGGDVVLVGSPHMDTLMEFKYQRHYKAEVGGPGGASMRTGRNGEDLILKVPVGTMIFDEETDELLGDIVESDQRIVIAEGGKGGKGNVHFKSAVRQTPLKATDGKPAVVRRLRLELKLIAHIGLVGAPNAGKSTLLAALTQARPKIAPYPFTTLTPNLGVLVLGYDRRLVLADIPGLIEGASEGKGLGLDFLKHIERTEILLYMIDASGESLKDAVESIRGELAAYSKELVQRPSIIAWNKIDLLTPARIKKLPKKVAGIPCMAISAAGRTGIEELSATLEKMHDELRRVESGV
jgi:GTPase